LRNRRRYWELTEELKIEINGNDSLSIENREEIYVFPKCIDLLISSMPNNTNNKRDENGEWRRLHNENFTCYTVHLI